MTKLFVPNAKFIILNATFVYEIDPGYFLRQEQNNTFHTGAIFMNSNCATKIYLCSMLNFQVFFEAYNYGKERKL